MTQILHKRALLHSSIRAGTSGTPTDSTTKAYKPEQVDIVPGAAGGPKGIGIQGLDQAIFGEFFAQAPKASYCGRFFNWQLALCQYFGVGRKTRH